jgi:hypothetical protein
VDKLDQNLKLLPRHTPAADLGSRVCGTVFRRHRIRTTARRMGAAALALTGLALAFPGLAGLSPDLFSSAVPWLSGSLGIFEIESVQAVLTLWSDMFLLQTSIRSALLVSGWLGILLMGAGLLAGMDWRVFQPPLNVNKEGIEIV